MKLGITDRAPASLWKRLAWLAGIWLASVLALTLVAYAIRLVLIH
ncbi:MAG: hypothetical protein B7Y12_04320 [Rhizobiales bacterium 24-66-13]|nr:MAG: hypothetical protein B7Y61_04850 [Rhizobiales bacterium 35-66-30]OYZ82226.1 MAG: hypothetical protein B7Y12_04320 [Rhizobiales bacterium 24-66-13]OZB07940.1 MAG: hypothetical protein B7X67_08165 [Rhizobiales bacterium 39-66-18]HQS45767.1 DUF2474 family protein [Xanthobacteraceae bacterium]